MQFPSDLSSVVLVMSGCCLYLILYFSSWVKLWDLFVFTIWNRIREIFIKNTKCNKKEYPNDMVVHHTVMCIKKFHCEKKQVFGLKNDLIWTIQTFLYQKVLTRKTDIGLKDSIAVGIITSSFFVLSWLCPKTKDNISQKTKHNLWFKQNYSRCSF